eukprot:33348-Pelagomonas_calceolata.AAC.2
MMLAAVKRQSQRNTRDDSQAATQAQVAAVNCCTEAQLGTQAQAAAANCCTEAQVGTGTQAAVGTCDVTFFGRATSWSRKFT